MKVSNNYVVVEKVTEEVKEGEFQTVEVQDSSLFKGKVTHIPEAPVYLGNEHLNVGDTILFAKYSPDTHDINHDGNKLKFINTRDILAKI